MLIASWNPEEALAEMIQHLVEINMLYLFGVMLVAIIVLGKSADWMVEKAVTLSLRTGMPKVIVGATIVSVGTTFPEAVVSVLAALNGNPDIALGNAVGSVICDAGLILGTACLIAPLPLNKKVVNRQGWVQFGAGVLLVLFCLPYTDLGNVFETKATLPQWAGFILVSGLVVYMIWSVRLAKLADPDELDEEAEDDSPVAILVGSILVGSLFVVASSVTLIEATKILATEAGIPEAVIASTLVAFGTSLPELVTAVTAARKGQGELAVGNVIGADILNVLFVAGAAAAITKEGLVAEPIFFKLQFPAMLIILLCFRIGIFAAKDGKLSRPFGAFLVTVYVIYGVLNAIFGKTQDSDVEVSQLSQSSAAQATEYFEPVDISFPLSR
ncbi:calcium/sodium antiporter [Pirellulaceae bacterium]|nr:calcium/sodium antiporter [Pirellulaceae bacterium]